ncbi:protoglobin domain-containing protein [Rhodocytophaga aerolata]|uniref:Protoglobin domain-containing protein n=1 Tax=Rhodocytophaga aerolata TaxID=455078 RepID=A0ABT8REV2_9BACT|nr:protoglobin domain-containing protein [Rhodocytophaga aerolata]MDO1449713.1 protoglobin domain-containing protein [Rhodocytophaga aerolata]
MQTQIEQIPGYTYGQVDPSPVSEADLDLLKQTVLFSDEDVQYLRLAGIILEDQTDAVLDVWYGFVGAHPHLARYFGKNNNLDANYLANVRRRFGKWIMDTCTRAYDQDWLNYQHEIGLRHLVKKNQTDGVDAEPIIHFRYLVAFIVPITATIKPFLASKGHSASKVEKMYAAWFKATTLTVTLWCYPYTKAGTF